MGMVAVAERSSELRGKRNKTRARRHEGVVPSPDSFKYRYDPVAETIKQRDTYPQVALVLINMAARLDVPRPTFLTRSRTQLENRSSARIERGGGPTMADG